MSEWHKRTSPGDGTHLLSTELFRLVECGVFDILFESYVKEKIDKHCDGLRRACVIYVRTDLLITSEKSLSLTLSLSLTHTHTLTLSFSLIFYDTLNVTLSFPRDASNGKGVGWAKAIDSAFRERKQKFVLISSTHQGITHSPLPFSLSLSLSRSLSLSLIYSFSLPCVGDFCVPYHTYPFMAGTVEETQIHDVDSLLLSPLLVMW